MFGFDTSRQKIELYANELEAERLQKEKPLASLRLQAKASRSDVNPTVKAGYKGLTALPRCPKCNAKKIGHSRYCRECGYKF